MSDMYPPSPERPGNGGEPGNGGGPGGGAGVLLSCEHGFDGERFLDGPVQVLVRDGRIVAVRPGRTPAPAGWSVIDYPGCTLLPGLIDTHVHLVAGGEPDALTLDVERTAARREHITRRSLQQQVDAGVTAVRDLGDSRWSTFARVHRDDEPTVVGSGPPITSVGGHCAALGGEASGPAALRDAVAQRSERGAQTIKIVVSGGAMTAGSDLLALQYGPDDLRLVVEQAHRRGLPVTAHAHSVPSVEVCLAAGVDGIEHCTCLTPTGIRTPTVVIDTLAARRIEVCPTFGRLPGLPLSPQALEINRRTGMSLRARFAQVGDLYRAGVPLLAGSDAGIHPGKPHGVLRYSVLELVGSGLPLAAALATATSRAADVCGLGGRTGRLREGLDADLLVVEGDLAVDADALTRIRRVVLRGRTARVSVCEPPPRS